MSRQLDHRDFGREQRTFPITLCCPDWTDPLNVGAAFRLADAAGLSGLVLCGGTPRPPHRKITRTARSTVQSVRYETEEDTLDYLGRARARGAVILGLEITDTSVPVFDYSPPAGEIILIAGAESAGIDAAVLSICDATIHLPMYGNNSSMNVAVAVGAAVYLLLMKLQ